MRRRHIRGIAVLLLAALFAASCGGRDDETATDDATDEATGAADGEATEVVTEAPTEDATEDTDGTATGEATAAPTEETPADPCEGVTLEATDTGVTADTITVVAMADVESPLAPGLFKGAWDGVQAWADKLNSEGGLACRQIEVIQWDSMLNGNETINGFLKACESALAMVGTTVLFSSNTEDQQTCPDAAGNPVGVADFAYIVTEPAHQCSPNSLNLQRPGASCPYESGVRDYNVAIGAAKWLAENTNDGNTHGIFLIPSDLPSTIAASMPVVRGIEAAGVVNDGEFGVSGRLTQPEFAPFLQAMQAAGSNFAYNGSSDQAMLKLRLEAEAQGIDASTITWMCSLSCYTPQFLEQGGEAVEGTYVWTIFLPFNETDANPELADFMSAIGDPFPASWAAGAWATGVLFEEVINEIVAESGPNGITRQAVLDRARGVTGFNANGMWGDTDFTTTLTQTDCFVIMQIQNGEFVRIFPEEPGTRSCDPANLTALSIDPVEEYSKNN
jgi:ABC-type branched-subunit amino acid transport system substrate-binding protein